MPLEFQPTGNSTKFVGELKNPTARIPNKKSWLTRKHYLHEEEARTHATRIHKTLWHERNTTDDNSPQMLMIQQHLLETYPAWPRDVCHWLFLANPFPTNFQPDFSKVAVHTGPFTVWLVDTFATILTKAGTTNIITALHDCKLFIHSFLLMHI